MTDLKNKNALITGAGKGIGKAIALALAKECVNIILVARTQEEIDSDAISTNKMEHRRHMIVLPPENDGDPVESRGLGYTRHDKRTNGVVVIHEGSSHLFGMTSFQNAGRSEW